jgi:hypothetical protein
VPSAQDLIHLRLGPALAMPAGKHRVVYMIV